MAANSGAIRAGRAFVELFADPSKLRRALDDAKKRIQNFAHATAKIGVAISGAASTVLAPMAKVFTDAVGDGAEVGKLARRWRMSAGAVSTLRGAFAQAGASSQEFESAMDRLGDKIAEAANKNDELIEGLRGLRGMSLLGKDKGEQLDAFAEKFKTIVQAEDQVRIASQFGLLPLLDALKKGKAGLDELRAAAVANGDAMNSEDVKAAVAIQKEYRRVVLSVKSTVIALGRALLPAGKSFAEVGAAVRWALGEAREWIAEHRQGIVVATALAAGVAAAGAAILGFSATVAAAATILGGLSTAIGVAGAIAAACFSPVGLGLAAIAGVTASLAYLWSTTEEGQGALADISEVVSGFRDTFVGAWKGISDAMKAGDWSLAFQIGVASADLTWKKFVNGVTIAWVGFKDTFVTAWRSAITWMRTATIDLATFIAKAISTVIYAQVKAWNWVASKLGRAGRHLQIDLDGIINTPAQVERKAEDWKRSIIDENARNEQDSRRFRDSQTWKTSDAVQRAEKLLRELREKAAREAKDAERQKDRGDKPNGRLQPRRLPPSYSEIAQSVKGIFSGPAQMQLGYGDNTAQRQLDAQIGIQRNTGKTVALMEEIAKRGNQATDVFR